ncbi:saccharopine dehydrogenase family protein [Streptomyces spiralis]|uniref:saccharopine dehydrogenase family protein n=1 Tax=Streptomyces spiralis TaxID=66376 RepID=UPI0036AB8F31
MTGRPITVYGASGYTGRLVAKLASRTHNVVLAGRNAESLHEVADELDTPAQVRVVSLDDPGALRAAVEDTAVVINCAGPFSRTGEPVAMAALAAGCHYLDHAADPLYVKHLFDTFEVPAREANTVMIPGMSFYGAIADLLTSVVTSGLSDVDAVTVAYAVNGWRMTAASKATAAQLNGADRVLYSNGTHRVAPARAELASFEFPQPIGTRAVLVDYPASEVVTIPRHVRARSVQVLMTTDTFTEDAVFTSENIDAVARARSTFTIVVRATSVNGTRIGRLLGHDIYRVGATASVEAATRLATGHTPLRAGVLSAAQAFRPDHFIESLQHQSLATMILE